jgi:hypothetical protein
MALTGSFQRAGMPVHGVWTKLDGIKAFTSEKTLTSGWTLTLH